MPYTTENGVTIYSDHDTPAEYATSQDEDVATSNALWQEESLAAFDLAEELYDLLDSPARPPSVEPEELVNLGADLRKLVGQYKALLRRS